MARISQLLKRLASPFPRRRKPFYLLAIEPLEDRTAPAVFTWANSAGGSWQTASNWTPVGVPSINDDVVIPDLTGSPTITYGTATSTINSLLTHERVLFTFTGGTGNGLTINNLCHVIDAQLDVQRSATFNGNLVLDNSTLSIGSTDGTVSGITYFRNFNSNPLGSITGTGWVIFGGSSSNRVDVYSTQPGFAGTLTIGSGITVGGKNGEFYHSFGTATVVNQGAISVDTSGANIRLAQGGGTFANQGTINLSAGTLSFKGNTTLAGLGSINRTGGTVEIGSGGILDLQGGTWNLNAVTGSWYLAGGQVKNGTLVEANGALLIPNTYFTPTLSNMTVYGDLDLTGGAYLTIDGGLALYGTMYLGNTAGTTYGRAFFGTSTSPAGALTGTATVVFGSSANNAIENDSNLAGAAGTMTFGSNCTVRGMTGVVNCLNANGSIVNQGTIFVENVGANIKLGGNGLAAFTNQQTINVSAGTIDFYGAMTLAGLGTINRTGGVVNLRGVLDLQNGTLPLNAATGSWNLRGGEVKNGTLSENDGFLLLPNAGGGTLTNLIVNGNLDLAQATSTYLYIKGGIELNGTMYLGKADGSSQGDVYFGNFDPNPVGSFTGNATVVFGGSVNSIVNYSNQAGATGTLTIGPQVTIRGKIGRLYAYYAPASVLNQGIVVADIPGGTIHMGIAAGGTFTNSGTMAVSAGELRCYGTNQGTINLTNATLGLGRLTLAGLGTINRTGGTINIVGVIDLQGASLTLNATTGSWNMDNGGELKNGTLNETAQGMLVWSGSYGGTLRDLTVNGDLNLGQLSSPSLQVLGTLVLNGTMYLGNAAGTTNGNVNFGSASAQNSWLLGTATVVFGGAGSNSLGISNPGQGYVLNIGSGITIRGKNGSVPTNGGQVISQATIVADTAGGTIVLGSFSGALINKGVVSISAGELTLYSVINQGTINLTAGTLSLSGIMTLGNLGLGTIYRGGGAVNLRGTLDLQGGTLSLNASTGSWNLLFGAEIKNGTVIEVAGATLLPIGGSLTNLTVNGDLDLRQSVSQVITINGGLVLNGTMYLGNANATNYAWVNFGTATTPAGSLTGNGTVVFGDYLSSYNNYLINGSNLAGAAGTLTFGPGITIRGKKGGIQNYQPNGSVVNQGNIIADTPSGIIALGVGTGSFTNAGTISAQNGGTISFSQSIALGGNAVLSGSPTGTVQFAGSVLSSLSSADVNAFRLQGTTVLTGGSSGSPKTLEVMSKDLGNLPTGFTNNLAFGTVQMASGSYWKLVDDTDNIAGASEAVYVASLVVSAGATLDLNGRTVFVRAKQISGTVIYNGGGNIVDVPDSGPIALGPYTAGAIFPAGNVDEWTFFGRAGRLLTIHVHPGGSNIPAPIGMPVGMVRIQLLKPLNPSDPTHSAYVAFASAASSTAGPIVALDDISLPYDTIYKIQIDASPGPPATNGNYLVGAWDTTPNVRAVSLNQPVAGGLATPFGRDQWTFTAAVGQQIQFDWINAAGPWLTFSLTGPNSYAPFTDIVADSLLYTLPYNGTYTLTARSTAGGTGGYSFAIKQTSVVELTLGATYNDGQFVGSGQAQLFHVSVATAQVLSVALNDPAIYGRSELYVRLGSAPTRENYDYAATGYGRRQGVFVSSAVSGEFYVLVYGQSIPTPGGFTLLVSGTPVKLESSFPTRAGNTAPVMVTVHGAGFVAGSNVALIASNGTTTYNPTALTVDGFNQMTATFPAGLPADTYSVRVSNGASTDTAAAALVVTVGGQARLETKLYVPFAVRLSAMQTLYVEYANTGDLAMPAPLLSLQSADPDNLEKLILTLDANRLVQSYWSGGLPPGTANTALILGSGKQPGILNPGERITVPVYFLGLQPPWISGSNNAIEFQIRYWTEGDTTPIDWASRQEALRPPLLSAEQWAAVYGNVTSGIGTSGAYVQMLNQNAQYLAKLGESVSSVDDLWNFEVQQAYGYTAVPTLDSVTDAAMPTPGVSLDFSRHYGNTIQSRYASGPLGRGWFSPWFTKLISSDGGNLIQIVGEGSTARTFQRDSRTGLNQQVTTTKFFAGVGDSSTLSIVSAGIYELRSVDGTVTRFRIDGKLDYIRDTNGNKVTAGYDGSGRWTTLTHSNGATLTITYNAVSLISTVTDSAGRITTYGYDVTNTYLTTVTTPDNKVTQYAYQATGAAQVLHALLSIQRGGTTQYFTYDGRGRLDSSFLTGNAEFIDYGYDDAGLVTVADFAGTTSLYFDYHGLLAKVTDPLGNITSNYFNADMRLAKTVGPTGESQGFTWCNCGSLTSITDELGQTTTFAYDNPLKRMTSFTDARGNVTSYTYDSNGNLMTTVYPNGLAENYGSYTAAGLAGNYTNRRGQPLSYTYNAAGQITKQTFADATFITFAYNTRGDLTTVTDGTKITTYTYSLATDGDRLKRITYPGGRYLDYLYDSFGRRIRMTDQSGYQTRYEYDPAGRLYRLRDAADAILVTYTYDAAGRLSRIDKGNGTFTTYDYDAAGQLLSLKNWRSVSTLNSKFDYTYDSRGRRISMTTLDGAWTYTYDGTGQLTRAIFASLNTSYIPNQDLKYFYDAVGNRVSTDLNGVVTNYVANELNQYTSVGGVGQAYDLDGNLTFDGVNTYAYDQQSRLVTVTGPSGITQYEYDAFDNRVATVINGARTEYLNDPMGLVNVAAEYTAAGSLIARYIHGLGLVSLIDASATTAFYDFDAIGSAAGLTTALGGYVNTYVYRPFGESLLTSQSILSPFQFVGRYGVISDGNSVSQMNHRFYSHASGRFVSRDPIGLLGGVSLYAYVGNDPVSLIDPTGLYGQAIMDGQALESASRLLQSALHLATPFECTFTYVVAGASAGIVLGAAIGLLTLQAAPILLGAAVVGAFGYGRGLGVGFQFCFKDHSKSHAGGGGGVGYYAGSGIGYIFFARDPNEKRAGAGYGSQSFVAGGSVVPYRIDFENDSTATAPAQVVTIVDQLSANFDWSTFGLTEIAWGDLVIGVPAGMQHYQTTVAMTYNGKTFNVLVEAGINTSTGQVFANFQSIDPNTELPPDVLAGFLPPEDGSGRGLGHVSYVIRAITGLVSGTEIRNIAYVTFDYAETIATDQVNPHDPSQGVDPNKQARITIDSGLPASTVAALPAITNTMSFTVNWSGSDDANGSGVGGYDVYVSINGGEFTRFLTATSATSTVYIGAAGNTYGFYSVAIDNVGQRQPTPASAQAQTQIVDTVTLTGTLGDPNPATGDWFGYSVAVSGNYVVVGAIYSDLDGTDSGAAYVFDATTGALIATLHNPTPSYLDLFGISVAVSGNIVVVGATYDDTGALDTGSVYLFDARTGVLIRTINNPTPESYDEFGTSVAISGNVIVVGARLVDTGAHDAGEAYIFDATTGSLIATLNDPNPASDDYFGLSVAVSGNKVVVGGYRDDTGATDAGSAYVFDAVTGALLLTLNNPTPEFNDGFGVAVAISGSTILVGANGDDTLAPNAGTAYAFDATTGALIRTFYNPAPESGDVFGRSLSLSGNIAVIGASLDDAGAFNSGTAYVVDVSTGTLISTLNNPTPAISDSFGNAVAISGNIIFVGAYLDDTQNTDQGSTYIYSLAVADTTAPSIVGVYFDGSTWSAAFRTAAGNASYGYSAQVGANQLKSMPWSTINTVYIQFSEDVAVDSADLGVRGLNLANYSISSFTYDSVNFVAKWVLSGPIDTDRLILDLDGDSGAAVTDTSGNKLAGSWTEGVSTFPTTGIAGNDFKFRFVVAVGDADRNGLVRNADVNLVRANLFVDAGQAGYNIYADIDGNGLTRNADVNTVRSHLFVDPPAGPGPNRPVRGGGTGSRNLHTVQTGGRYDSARIVDQDNIFQIPRRPARTLVANLIDSLFEVD